MQKKLSKIVGGREVSSLQLYCVALPSRRLCVIEEVYTDPEHRGRGYSTGLISEAIETAKEWGADCIELTVRQDSPHIQKFYESFGFEDRKNVAMRLPLREIKPWSRR